MGSLELVSSSPRTLEELAEAANYEYAEAANSLASSIVHAICSGEALIEAHEIVKREGGIWNDWIANNLDFEYSRVAALCQLAHHKDRLPPEVFQPFRRRDGGIIQPSVSRAMIYVRGLPHLKSGTPVGIWNGGGPARITDEVRREVKRLRNEGLSQTETSEMLGISRHSVRKIEDPKYDKENRRRIRERRKERRLAAKALRNKREMEQRDIAAKLVGGSLEETYSLVRKALSKADSAHREARTIECRRHIDAVMTYLHRAEDSLGLAIRS